MAVTRRSREASLGENPDLDGAALDFLLDGALDGVRGSQALSVRLGHGEDGEALRNAVFEPSGELGGAVAVAFDQMAISFFIWLILRSEALLSGHFKKNREHDSELRNPTWTIQETAI